MKKRILILLFTAAMLLSCTAGVSGSNIVCFVAVNDTIPVTLPGEASPYYENGALYIPYTAFNGGPNGIFASYNAEKNTLAIANRGLRLVYDLEKSTVTDESGNETAVTLADRGGLLFLPGQFAANHFGLRLSLLTSETGCPVLRFTNGNEAYDDESFIKKAEFLISHILDYYEKEENTKPQNPEHVQKEPEKEEEEAKEPERGTVYLAFAGEAVSKETMKHLEALNAKGAFFVTTSQVEQQGNLIRELYGNGHTIGVTAEPGESDLAAALNAANEALYRCIFLKTPIALVPGDVTLPQYLTWNEEAYAATVDEILTDSTQPHLLLCRTDVLAQLKKLIKGKLDYLQLVETTRLPVLHTQA